MSHKLDIKDKKLLYELDLDSKQSFNQLAKKLRISKNAIGYRIHNLVENGLIKNFQTILDLGKLGFTVYRMYLKFQNTTPEKELEIIEFLKQRKIVTWLVSVEGDYDLALTITTKSVREMNALWRDLLSDFINYLDKRNISILTNISYFSRAYLLDLKENTHVLTFITEPEENTIDRTDMDILKLLVPNARITAVEIASRIKSTSRRVIYRIREMEKKGIIIGYKTLFDMNKLGYQYYKITFRLNNLTKEKEMQFRWFIKTNPNIIYDDEATGGEDLEIELQVKNIDELRSLLASIRKQFADIIKDYSIMEFYKEHKYISLPLK